MALDLDDMEIMDEDDSSDLCAEMQDDGDVANSDPIFG